MSAFFIHCLKALQNFNLLIKPSENSQLQVLHEAKKRISKFPLSFLCSWSCKTGNLLKKTSRKVPVKYKALAMQNIYKCEPKHSFYNMASVPIRFSYTSSAKCYALSHQNRLIFLFYYSKCKSIKKPRLKLH